MIMLESLVGQKVVVDLRSEYVCLGTLATAHPDYLELKNADLHDLRDTDTSRENYTAASKSTGIKRNRKKLFLFKSEIVAVSLLDDVVDD